MISAAAIARHAAPAAQYRAQTPPARHPCRLLPRWQARRKTTPTKFASRIPMAAVQTSGGIVVDNAPSQAKLEEMRVKSWPTWGCEASKFPWSYDSTETCYVLEGHVIVTPDGGEPVEIKAGDMATFPKGMSCTWHVLSAIQKHYKFS